ncbi:MAG: hypothetical protein ACKODH_14565 [Limisphaerales bacterium]
MFIGAVQPWLEFNVRPGGWHTNRSPNFATVSGLAGVCAVIAALAIFSLRSREVRSRICRSAVGLLVSGLASTAMVVTTFAAWISEASWSQHPFICTFALTIFLIFAVLPVVIFHGALKMLHCEGYAASRRAALCSIFSFNLLSLPVGIWTLVKLSQPEIQAVFKTREQELDNETSRTTEAQPASSESADAEDSEPHSDLPSRVIPLVAVFCGWVIGMFFTWGKGTVPFLGVMIGGLIPMTVLGLLLFSRKDSVAGRDMPGASATPDDLRGKLQLAGIGLLLAGIVNAVAGLIWIGKTLPRSPKCCGAARLLVARSRNCC